MGNGLACTMIKRYSLTDMRNGLVQTIAEAYFEHRALVLRPDDVWLAILAQFNFYVNAHAEELRHHFVSHQGRQKVVVHALGSARDADFGRLAQEMASQMEKFIADPELRSWILPGFSTTTANDAVVASVMMMATMKAYFDYEFSFTCGIPQVTLAGNREDWLEIVRRAAKLKEFGSETSAWYELLRPVLTRFVYAFDAPHSAENLNFWRRIAHFGGNGCGGPELYLSGWISAFCMWDTEGRWLGFPVSKIFASARRSSIASTVYDSIVEEAMKKTASPMPSFKSDVSKSSSILKFTDKPAFKSVRSPQNLTSALRGFIRACTRLSVCGGSDRLELERLQGQDPRPEKIGSAGMSTVSNGRSGMTLQAAYLGGESIHQDSTDVDSLWNGGLLFLDGVRYHSVTSSGVPSSFGTVNVLVDDNGDKFDSVMVAGIVGARVSDSGDQTLSPEGKDDTVTVTSGWWIYRNAKQNSRDYVL